ncbi:hypothetical protein [Chryseobacterium sp. Marseille-Q8038]
MERLNSNDFKRRLIQNKIAFLKNMSQQASEENKKLSNYITNIVGINKIIDRHYDKEKRILSIFSPVMILFILE